ncbi:MAG: hypothetical protein KF773_36830 [Deltaproteobacteria bacterium]|nr:hypothetical protein [Deltaproteobacteria bacterium]
MKRIVLALVFLAGVAATAAASAEGDETPRPPQRQHEILSDRPSGFWTSNRPAQHGAYRWRLLAVGCVLATGTGFLLFRLLRRAGADRIRGGVTSPRTAGTPPSPPASPDGKLPGARVVR